MRDRPPFPNITRDALLRANEEWGVNCGPAAVAAVMGMTLDQVRPHMGDFERKRYMNPTLMYEVLDRIGRPYRRIGPTYPDFGLARIQWEGPWTAPGVPIRVRYRHTHWVGWCRNSRYGLSAVFDVNAIGMGIHHFGVHPFGGGGGWLCYADWSTKLVPWILKECEAEANGRWHVTHGIEVEP